MPGSMLFEDYNRKVMLQLDKLTDSSTQIYAEGIMLILLSSVTLYVLWAGYQTLAGKMQTPIQDVLWNLAKFGIIITFINNYDGYLTAVIDAMSGLKAGFAGSGESVWMQLDTMWDKTQTLADTLYSLDNSTYVKAEGALALLLVWAGSICLMLVGGLTFFVADVTMLFMTVTAPLFIFCLMFGFLRTMFNNWLQLIFSSILTVMFATLVINVGINYMGSILAQAQALGNSANLVTLGATSLVAGILTAAMVTLAKALAGQIAGVSAEGAVQGLIVVGAALAAGAAGTAVKFGSKGGVEMGKGVGKGLTQGGDATTNSAAEWTGKQMGRHLSPAYLATKARIQQAIENMKAKNNS
ncbi:type IV secretion system protein [Pseudomonas amygdali pv. morsprunorum]|uniref:type IV secretion system protein n=1 Tax=Pseudomonas amygdali TaxID=47877 RepID=UPI00288FD5EA|nr:type IV secretion system protein [Pseudomonas amygdali]MDT3268700.1 type IV secretion system protein [Pseudomonas amygdali pv. morsprunorum]